jgi:acyl-CoA reductase-like NAD-dependent aldehyde dehydrogenase
MSLWRQEVFGPVVSVVPFSHIDEAIALANDSEFGLANCVWSSDTSLAARVGAAVHAGTSWINTYGMFYPSLPYGGFRRSGFGKELGKEGLLEYTRLKNIVTDRTQDGLPLVNYWYGF